MFDEMENKIFPTIIKRPINNFTSNKFLNNESKIPLIKLTTSYFPDFWCYGNYTDIFDKTIQSKLEKTIWDNELEDCFIDFGEEDDDKAINKKKEIVNYSKDKPFYFNLYRLELIVVGNVSDELTDKLYVADPQKLNYLVKSFLREIPLDFPYDWSRDDRRDTLKKKGDHSNNIYSFFQFHFEYFDGYKEDFMNNLIEITNDIWRLRIRENQFRRELLNEWIEEKIEEYDLDRSKLDLEPPKPMPKPTTALELIKLNYEVNNDKIIQLLHVELNGTFIENIDFNDFERHFKDNGAELKKMQWKGTQPEIVCLIQELKKINEQQYILIVNHFYDLKNNKEFSNTQLGTVYQKLNKDKQKEVNIVLNKIKILVDNG